MPPSFPAFPMSCARWLLGLVIVAAAGACTPTFNWREVPLGDEGVVALLPCKAERAHRLLPLGADQVAVDMAGCEAGGATFAIARASATDGVQAAAWLAAWQRASRERLAGRRLVEDARGPARAAPSPAPARLDTADEAAASGAALQAHMQWFAVGRPGGGMALFQATVTGRPSAPDAITNFFDGLRLP